MLFKNNDGKTHEFVGHLTYYLMPKFLIYLPHYSVPSQLVSLRIYMFSKISGKIKNITLYLNAIILETTHEETPSLISFCIETFRWINSFAQLCESKHIPNRQSFIYGIQHHFLQ